MTIGHNGGPAFPACNEANNNNTMGMTLRDWFAGQALPQAVEDYGTPAPMAGLQNGEVLDRWIDRQDQIERALFFASCGIVMFDCVWTIWWLLMGDAQ